MTFYYRPTVTKAFAFVQYIMTNFFKFFRYLKKSRNILIFSFFEIFPYFFHYF
nr:hypothetical protein MtrDRAFT_AC149206g29v2 [Medicago truncatula]